MERAGGFAAARQGQGHSPLWAALDAGGVPTDNLHRMRFVRVTGSVAVDGLASTGTREHKHRGRVASTSGAARHGEQPVPLAEQPAFVPLAFGGDAELEDVATAAANGLLRCRLCGCAVTEAGSGCDRAVRLLAGSDTHDRGNVAGFAADDPGLSSPAISPGKGGAEANCLTPGSTPSSQKTKLPETAPGYGGSSAAAVQASSVSAAGAAAAGISESGWMQVQGKYGALVPRARPGPLALTSDIALSRRLGMWVCGGLEFTCPVVSKADGTSGADSSVQPLAVLGLLATSARKGFIGVGQHELLIHPLDSAAGQLAQLPGATESDSWSCD